MSECSSAGSHATMCIVYLVRCICILTGYIVLPLSMQVAVRPVGVLLQRDCGTVLMSVIALISGHIGDCLQAPAL